MIVTTTNHNEKILYCIGTICTTQRSCYLVDQAIQNYIRADQSTSFGTFVNSFDFKQEVSNIEYENGKTLKRRAGGVYYMLRKGVTFAKKLKRDGNTHWDNPQQWDVGEYERFNPFTFVFPPTTYRSVLHAKLEKYTPAQLEKLLVIPMYRNTVEKVLEKKIRMEKETLERKITNEKEKEREKENEKEKEKLLTILHPTYAYFVQNIRCIPKDAHEDFVEITMQFFGMSNFGSVIDMLEDCMISDLDWLKNTAFKQNVTQGLTYAKCLHEQGNNIYKDPRKWDLDVWQK